MSAPVPESSYGLPNEEGQRVFRTKRGVRRGKHTGKVVRSRSRRSSGIRSRKRA